MGDVTNIDRDDANAKSDIDYMCVYVRVCVCVCVGVCVGVFVFVFVCK